MSRMILDAGAFVAYERGDSEFRARIGVARRRKDELITSSPVIAQVWRDGRQALIATLIRATEVIAPDEIAARRAGELLGKTDTTDVVDALVVGLARDGDLIVTSDPDDLEMLIEAAGARVVVVTV